MVTENTQTQMRKGILEYCILAIISGGEIYASDIIAELKNAKLMVVEGTLYPLLTRLKNNNLLIYNWVESASGPPRKYFKLSEEVKQVLESLHLTWKELAFAVQMATEHSRKEQQERESADTGAAGEEQSSSPLSRPEEKEPGANQTDPS